MRISWETKDSETENTTREWKWCVVLCVEGNSTILPRRLAKTILHSMLLGGGFPPLLTQITNPKARRDFTYAPKAVNERCSNSRPRLKISFTAECHKPVVGSRVGIWSWTSSYEVARTNAVLTVVLECAKGSFQCFTMFCIVTHIYWACTTLRTR